MCYSRVPADCRLVDAVELLVDESMLTGETLAVTKTSAALDHQAVDAINQQTNIVFQGTLVHAGRGRAMVVAVGPQTEFGKIATELQQIDSRKSPLQNQMDQLGQRLAAWSSLAIAIMAVVGWLLGRPFLETLTISVSLAVAAIPEGLPICVTVTLALGVLRMARRNAICKRLPVVEALGCTTTICTDKTGTLTQNEMTVRLLYLPNQMPTLTCTGVGYSTSGQLQYVANNKVVTSESPEYPAVQALLYTGMLCNNASLEDLTGQPTELALLVVAHKAGLSSPQYHRLAEIPFSSERKRMQVQTQGSPVCAAFTDRMYFVKGMPEAVIFECKYEGTQTFTDESKTQTMAQARQMAATGLRVLALAYGPDEEHLTFAGLISIEDPPRLGVAEAVRNVREGGVKVIMVTGDSRETACAMATRCGIVDDPEQALSMSGAELDQMQDKALSSILPVRVFYRVEPRHKLAIVRALQQRGEVVAVSGDG